MSTDMIYSMPKVSPPLALQTSSPVILQFLKHQIFCDAAVAAGNEWCVKRYEDKNSAIPFINGDGMSGYTVFKREMANHFSRHGQEHYVTWITKRKKNEHLNFIGDQIFYDPYKGQARFTINYKKELYQLLQMTAQVNDDRIEVGDGLKNRPARQEYLKNQNSSVPTAQGWSLDEVWEPENYGGLFANPVNDGPIRLLLVTELSGKDKEHFRLLVCLPDGQFNTHEGSISIIEKHVLIDDEIRNIVANFRESKSKPLPPLTSPHNKSEFDFDIGLNEEDKNNQKAKNIG